MPIKYVPFIPEPVEGQAVLGNFNRILKYKGADDVSMTLQRGMPLYEMEKQETVGENADGNMVIRGECVSACAYLKSQGIQVDLVYIDPPFASGADYAKKVYIRRNPKVAEAIAQAEQELDVDELKEHILEIEGVIDLHHIHIWSMDSVNHFATMHVVVGAHGGEIKQKIKAELKEHGIAHATLELETEDEHCADINCHIETDHNHGHHHHHHHGHHHGHNHGHHH